MSIETYQGLTLSYERAAALAPSTYLPGYQWFLDHEGELGPRPWKEHAPENMPITLVAQRGGTQARRTGLRDFDHHRQPNDLRVRFGAPP